MPVHDTETYIREWLDLKMVRGRYSAVFVTQLADHWEQRTANVFAIFDEIEALERPDKVRATRTKKARPLTGALLRGLSHKHYFQAAFILKNLQNHWAGREIPASADEIVLGGYQARSRSREITGEWIVYAKVSGVNYYLTLGKHHGDDPAIAARVKACLAQFPEVRKVWSPRS